MLCLGVQNHVKTVLTWLFYQTASFGIKVQKSSIGQKFRPLRAPQIGNIWRSLEIKQKKQLNIYKKFHFFGIIEAREVAEISDRSTIFGLRYHMSVHVQLYAYITLIYKNMGKNAKNVLKMWFLELKCVQRII